jgi:FkbM family methyltransferase
MILQTLKDGTELWTHDKGEYISDVISQTKWYYEPKTIDYIKSLNLEKCTILDVGANIGNHTHAINKFTKDCYVISIEPFEKNLEILKLNHNNGHILNWFADNDINAYNEIEFKISPIWGKNNLGYIKQTNEGQTVNVNCIDSIFLENLALIKLDIEGNELNALKGALHTIGVFKPIIIAEHHTESEHLEVLSYLKQFGYSLETIIEEDNINYVYSCQVKK